MTKNPQDPPPDEKSERDAAAIAANVASPDANRRRRGLLDFLAQRGLNPTDVARTIGAPTPNAIFNFLGGRSAALSLEMIERILRAYPASSFAELGGLPLREVARADQRAASNASIASVPVCVIAQAGVWRQAQRLPEDQWERLPLPNGLPALTGAEFGVRVQQPGAELLYPHDAILVCRRPFARADYQPGSHFVVSRHRGRLQEVTVRVLAHRDGQRVLRTGTTYAAHRDEVAFPRQEDVIGVRDRRSRIMVIGHVVASWHVERYLPFP